MQIDSGLIQQTQTRRNYAANRRYQARKKLKSYRAEAKTVTSEYAETLLIDFIACGEIELLRWKSEQGLQSLILKQYRSMING